MDIKINNTVIDSLQIFDCQASLSDSLRIAFYNADSILFGLLNYEDDFTFLEPSVFCYFLSDMNKTDKIPLLQSVTGYIPAEKRLAMLSLTADRFGMINLPNLGYIRTSPNNNSIVDLNNRRGVQSFVTVKIKKK